MASLDTEVTFQGAWVSETTQKRRGDVLEPSGNVIMGRWPRQPPFVAMEQRRVQHQCAEPLWSPCRASKRPSHSSVPSFAICSLFGATTTQLSLPHCRLSARLVTETPPRILGLWSQKWRVVAVCGIIACDCGEIRHLLVLASRSPLIVVVERCRSPDSGWQCQLNRIRGGRGCWQGSAGLRHGTRGSQAGGSNSVV